MRTSASAPPPAAASPLELTVSLVAPDAAASVLRTVQRARHKPMGQFRKWTIEHTNTRCDVVRAMRVQGGATSDAAAAIVPGTMFVLDLVGQRVGRLYRARSATSVQDVLADSDAVYEVHDIRRLDEANATQYVLRLAPYKAPAAAATAARAPRASSGTSSAALRPVWGSRLTVFFETQDRLDGRVVWTDAEHVDVQVEDTAHAKVWLRLTPSAKGGADSGADPMHRPTLTEYRLDRAETPSGVATWRASRRAVEATVDRLRYQARTDDGPAGDADDARALRRHLARAAPHGFGHVVLLQATPDPATVGRVRKDSVEPVAVAQADGAATATLERSARVDRAMPKAFPWSPTRHVERLLASAQPRSTSKGNRKQSHKQSRTSATTTDVPLHLQPAAGVYRSWLQQPEDTDRTARETDRYHVLLPSASDLRDHHPLRSCAQAALDTVYLHVTGPDVRRMVEYVLGDAVLGQGLTAHVVEDGVAATRGSRGSRRNKGGAQPHKHTTVRLRTNAHSARRLRTVLLGQAVVTLVDKAGKADRTVQSRVQRADQLRHGDRALTQHWGYMGGHWRYDAATTTDADAQALVWTPSAFHTPVTTAVDADEQAQPLPLLHTTVAPSGHQRTTSHQFQLSPTTYWPPRDVHDDYETRGQCLRRLRPEPYARILHKQVGKQMAGTGFKALMDIEELRNPGWCNVEVTGEADLVRALHATATTAPHVDAPTAVSHLALAPDLQTLACDADGHVGAQYFARCPDAGADDADAQAACRAVASREALASVVRAHPTTSLLRYGLDADAASNLPPLSHYLYGTQDRPKHGVHEAFQCKPSLVRRVVDGYATRRLVLGGVYSQARWARADAASLTTRPGAGVEPWRLTVRPHGSAKPVTQTVALLPADAPDARSTYPVPTLCAAWTRALRRTFPAAGFDVRYDGHTHALTVAAHQPFTVVTGMGAWGVADGTRANISTSTDPRATAAARADSATPHHTVHASVAALCGHGPYAFRARPARLDPRTACTVRVLYEVAGDAATADSSSSSSAATDGAHEPVPVVAVCAPCPGVEPFEAADAARFATRPGRHVGRSRYTSVPVAGHPLHLSIVDAVGKASPSAPLMLVVRPHHAALVDATTGVQVHGATLDWSSSVAGAIARPTDVDVDTRFDAATRRAAAWRVVHLASGEVQTVTVDATKRRVDVAEAPTLALSARPLCRTHQTTLRGELVYEVRASVEAATGGHGVEVWRLTRTPEATTAPTRVRRVALATEALAAAFVTDPSTGARFVLVAEAGATLTLHPVDGDGGEAAAASATRTHPWQRLFPRTLPRSATARAHGRLVAVGAAAAATTSNDATAAPHDRRRLHVALGFDGRADVEWLTLGADADLRPCATARVATLLTGKELAASGWWWRPHVAVAPDRPHAAVQVTLRAPKPAASVTVHDCRLGLAAQLETALGHWLGAPLDTLDVHYAFPDETLPVGSALMHYLLQAVVGHRRTTPTATLTRYLHDRAATLAAPVTLDPRAHLRAYYATQPHDVHTRDNEVVDDPLHHLPREAARTTQALSHAYHAAVGDALATAAPRKASVAPATTPAAPATTATATPPEAKRAVFYAKVHRLLQDSGEGIPYVQRVYKRSAHFRAQFHECKGFCYQRLLCKCQELRRGEGYGTRVRWTDAHRDATTFVADGEAYHLCQTCGERVCPQDAGLTKDYDAMGMSSTHSEHAHDQRLDDDAMAAATDADADNARQDWALASHAPIERLLRRLGLLAHRPKLDALLVSDTVFKILPGGKGAAPRAVKAPGCTLQTAQRLLDAKAAASLVTVYACAADALLLAMDRRNVLGSRAPPVPRSTAKERAVVTAFEAQFTFAAEELQSGIPPRPYYRPHLTPRVNVNVTPKGAHGWPRLDAIVNRLDTQRPALLDPSSLDVGPTVFAQRDQYLCAPQDLHQDSRTPYTSIARLLDPTIRPRAGDTATVPARLEFVRIHPWTRLCNALAPNAHTVLPVSNPRPNAPAAHAMTAATMPKHPLMWSLHAPPTDAQRREAVAKRILRYADATHGRFAYPLQVLLDTDLVKRHDPTTLLKWLVGVTSATRYRITAHPPTDFRMKPAWMQYYEQMEPDNKVAEELVKGLCCRVVGGG